ncbi:TIGR03618 family F420-dependent PPOX class oxidoreductase [Qaidamihabitans albus]|uniref:TIGR03618 family F420-dependent PPOX class oxidoreductase n=1 Tax=Qaidamihabitans albus TaxID=2795733 RepID=UPI0018F1BD22|nr:TIGR03618 family F420-dependent PPOX class oxidoreductase [Qaidamihabitans albus]
MPPTPASDEVREFWREWHLSTLTTLRPDGRPHVVPVGVTVDEEFGIARVICSRDSVKARNVRAAGAGGAPVALSQVDRRRWSTLEGRALVRDDPDSVRQAEDRYAVRYQRRPRVNPQRVVIEIAIERRLGMA